MSSASLTRAEAEQRAGQLDVRTVHVELDLTDPGQPTFSSTSTITFASTGSTTFVEFAGERLLSATLNGQPIDPEAWSGGRIALSQLQPENELVVSGLMAYSADGEGLHRHVDPKDGRRYLYAMSFLDAGPRWFACFDQPDLKARYRLEVAAPPEWTVLGNGPSRSAEPGRWIIEPLQPLSTYFVTLVAGPYASVTAEHDGIPLGLHVRASLAGELAAQAEDLLEVTRACLDYYHRVFGVRYPFGEYHQAFVPDFNAGAMENPGCVTLRDQMIFRGRATAFERGRRAGVVAHEMAHMWFGDLVTMRWWDDLWLNESFAEYAAHRAAAEVTAYDLWTEFGIVRKDWGAVADQSPATHPVAGNGAPDAAAALADFDGISYAKGAAVLAQLAAYLGEEAFWGGLRDYFGRYGYGNATFADLLGCWVAAGAVGLEGWAAAWLRTTGMDTLEVQPGASGPAVTVIRADPAQPVRPHTTTPGLVDATGAVRLTSPVTLTGTAVLLEAAPDTALVVPDGRNETWAKIRFGPNGWSELAAVLPRISDERVLVVAYNAIRDAVRDAALDPAVALDLIAAGVPAQESDLITSYLLGFAADQLAGPYARPGERAGRRERVHAVSRRLLETAQPGSDRQLTAFRLSVRTAADAARLRSWLAGDLPTGLGLDPELSWALVSRIAAVAGDADLIEQTLSRDPTASAQVHAAQARAALPDAAAKRTAWGLLMQPSELSAYELYATGDGFFVPEQHELTADCAAAYFDEIAATARFRSGWVLGEVAERAFPRTIVTADTLRRAEALLGTDLAPPIRRAVVDGADRLRRALTSLQRYSTFH